MKKERRTRLLSRRRPSLRSEYVVAVVGTVEKRSGAVNENLKTGEIEVIPAGTADPL